MVIYTNTKMEMSFKSIHSVWRHEGGMQILHNHTFFNVLNFAIVKMLDDWKDWTCFAYDQFLSRVA